MLRLPFAVLLILLLAVAGISGALHAQMETGERGILPIDSSGTLEITGIHVDVSAKDAQSARFAAWRIAQRQGFKALWAKTQRRPISEAPNLPDSTLDGLVSSIVVEREEIGPNRYIANLGILFDRARSAQLLGIGGEIRRSVPMLLIPILVTAGADTTIELRNPYVDPLNLLQAELLRRARTSDEAGISDALLVTVNGIAAGMRNTG